MDKLKPTGLDLVQVFTSRSGCLYAMHLRFCIAIRPYQELKTWPQKTFMFLPVYEKTVVAQNKSNLLLIHMMYMLTLQLF